MQEALGRNPKPSLPLSTHCLFIREGCMELASCRFHLPTHPLGLGELGGFTKTRQWERCALSISQQGQGRQCCLRSTRLCRGVARGKDVWQGDWDPGPLRSVVHAAGSL